MTPLSILRKPALPVLLVAAVYLVASLVAVSDSRTAHDEGLLMYGFSRGLSLSFAPVFFWQKCKPALALFYLPVARLGFGAYLVAHVLVAAAAVAAVGEVARALGHRRPWIASLVLALSPVFTWSSLVGISNSDGVAFAVLSLYLLVVHRRPALAGLVLGLLPWVRYESTIFAGLVVLYGLFALRSPRFLSGLCAWPIAYLGAGAVYHRDPLWFLHYLPGISGMMPGNEVWEGGFASHGFVTLVATYSLISAALGLCVLLRPMRLHPLERVLGLSAFAYLALFALTHVAPLNIGPAFVIGFSARYAALAVPSVALLVGRVVDAVEDAPAPALRDTLCTAALVAAGWLAKARGADSVFLWAGAAAGVVVGSLRLGAPAFALAAVSALTALGPLASREALERECRVREDLPARTTDWLEAHQAEITGTIYTNSQLLQLYLSRSGRLQGRAVKFIVAPDHSFEMETLTNHANGQREAIFSTIPAALFGSVAFRDEMKPELVAAGSLFVLEDDERTKLVLPPATWEPRLRTVHTGQRFRVARVERAAEGSQ
jgi:hypothetical protein